MRFLFVRLTFVILLVPSGTYTFSQCESELNLCFRVVVLESRPTDNPTAASNLYILAGHENSY